MNFSEALKKLEGSSEFRDFKKHNPDAYLCAGFFVLDFESGNIQQNLDYQLSDNKIATFAINNEINFKIEESMKKEKLHEIGRNIGVDVNGLKGLVDKELKRKNMIKNVNKIIAILQLHNNKEIWNLTCMLESFSMLRLHIDASDGSIIKSEKLNMFDFIKKV